MAFEITARNCTEHAQHDTVTKCFKPTKNYIHPTVIFRAYLVCRVCASPASLVSW